jgi:hypothetical protein
MISRTSTSANRPKEACAVGGTCAAELADSAESEEVAAAMESEAPADEEDGAASLSPCGPTRGGMAFEEVREEGTVVAVSAAGGGFEGAQAAADCPRCCASAATSSSLFSSCAFRLCGVMLYVRCGRLLTLRSTDWAIKDGSTRHTEGGWVDRSVYGADLFVR